MYLIIGASSFIGRHLYDYCKNKGIDVLGTYYMHSYYKEWIRFDMCADDLEEICNKHLGGKKPEAVIICGANASIDSCKRDENASNYLNITGTKRILQQAAKMEIKCVFLSSEAVFNGKKGMYTEDDIPDPITIYGNQKLQIEQFLIRNLNSYLIFRISRAVGSSFGENDIFKEFYNKIVNQEEIVCLKDQSFCLTEVNDISQCMIEALNRNLNGLYHISSPNYISRYDLANLYAEKMFGGYEKVVQKNYNEIPFLDKRHIYGGLKGDKLADMLGFHYMDIGEILDQYISTYEREK